MPKTKVDWTKHIMILLVLCGGAYAAVSDYIEIKEQVVVLETKVTTLESMRGDIAIIRDDIKKLLAGK